MYGNVRIGAINYNGLNKLQIVDENEINKGNLSLSADDTLKLKSKNRLTLEANVDNSTITFGIDDTNYVTKDTLATNIQNKIDEEKTGNGKLTIGDKTYVIASLDDYLTESKFKTDGKGKLTINDTELLIAPNYITKDTKFTTEAGDQTLAEIIAILTQNWGINTNTNSTNTDTN